MILGADFYAGSTLGVARGLIGQTLVRRIGRTTLAGTIVETEAYVGEDDRACHASRGRTPRTEVLFGPPGRAYVYLVYGMHCCLNAVTGPEGFAAAVLIRAIEPVQGIARMRSNRGRPLEAFEIASGPGKLCQAMSIDRRLNAASLTGPELWIEEGDRDPGAIVSSPRIGVDYAGSWKDRPWRFFVRDSPHVSRHRLNQVRS